VLRLSFDGISRAVTLSSNHSQYPRFYCAVKALVPRHALYQPYGHISNKAPTACASRTRRRVPANPHRRSLHSDFDVRLLRLIFQLGISLLPRNIRASLDPRECFLHSSSAKPLEQHFFFQNIARRLSDEI
jgi:hypothetical protein